MTTPHKPRTVPALSLVLAGAVLVAAAMLLLLRGQLHRERTFHGAVNDLLPVEAEVPTWKRETMQIADSPEMARRVGELLNYDDGAYAIYSKGNRRISVYVAYWMPGRMSYRLVAGHTPDICWVGAGWRIDAAQSGARLRDGAHRLLLPAEERTMSLSERIEYVAFWHLLDGHPMSYGVRGKPPWTAVFTDLIDRRLDQQPEQFFIRISSNEPLDSIVTDEFFTRLTGRLTMLWRESSP